MDLPQLPNVDRLLVTADNPARIDLSGMDHARCAALHNYLMHYAWAAEGRPPAQLRVARRRSPPRFHPSLAVFLDAALVRPVNKQWSENHEGVGPESMFFWALGTNEDPEAFFAREDADLHDEDPDSLVCLYWGNEGGGSGGGVYYHQGRHRAAAFLDMWDHDYAMPAAAHPTLERLFEHWRSLVERGVWAVGPRGVEGTIDAFKDADTEKWRDYQIPPTW
ncbi:hypothetical protein PG994_002633 [Apiospora phragmitis]|uniref:Uncharacterized protein n=1 Tax=Apiospora phragmitis TaxID=2905665 RepID=A0ABR1W5P0_9PEZI